jgi:hypothetical protein
VAASQGAVCLQARFRFTSWCFPADRPQWRHAGHIAVIAALGGGLLTAALVVSAAQGDSPEAYWLLIGPLPLLALGVAAYLRRPGLPVVWWLVAAGVTFGCDVPLGDVFLPMAAEHWGVTSSATAAIALLHQWLGAAAPITGAGLIGLFPSGRPERGYERAL